MESEIVEAWSWTVVIRYIAIRVMLYRMKEDTQNESQAISKENLR